MNRFQGLAILEGHKSLTNEYTINGIVMHDPKEDHNGFTGEVGICAYPNHATTRTFIPWAEVNEIVPRTTYGDIRQSLKACGWMRHDTVGAGERWLPPGAHNGLGYTLLHACDQCDDTTTLALAIKHARGIEYLCADCLGRAFNEMTFAQHLASARKADLRTIAQEMKKAPEPSTALFLREGWAVDLTGITIEPGDKVEIKDGLVHVTNKRGETQTFEAKIVRV